MKPDDQIDAIMAAIPERDRTNWCGGERGPCACLGCVQISNRAILYEKITGRKYLFDPEHISEARLQEHPEIYSTYKLSREEWDSWMRRQSFVVN